MSSSEAAAGEAAKLQARSAAQAMAAEHELEGLRLQLQQQIATAEASAAGHLKVYRTSLSRIASYVKQQKNNHQVYRLVFFVFNIFDGFHKV